MPRPVRLRVRAEGRGGQRQEHGALAPHGHRGAEESRSAEGTRREERRVPHHRKKGSKKKKKSKIIMFHLVLKWSQ